MGPQGMMRSESMTFMEQGPYCFSIRRGCRDIKKNVM